MKHINYGRVLAGGLLAGVIVAIGEFIFYELFMQERWLAVMERLGVEPPGAGVLILYGVLMVILGVAIVWLYAAIRPRFGPGPRTAVCAGLVVWFLIWVWSFAGASIWGFFPFSLVAITVIWALVEVVLAALAGGWLYREETETAPAGGGAYRTGLAGS